MERRDIDTTESVGKSEELSEEWSDNIEAKQLEEVRARNKTVTVMRVNDHDDDISFVRDFQVVLIQSEESIAKTASRHIEETLGRLKDTGKKNAVDEKNCNAAEEKTELDRRVRIGEITPFQAAEAIKSTESVNKRYCKSFTEHR